jgi:hypothetical protein
LVRSRGDGNPLDLSEDSLLASDYRIVDLVGGAGIPTLLLGLKQSIADRTVRQIRSKPMDRLPERNRIIARDFGLQSIKGDVEILGCMKCGKKLPLIFEAGDCVPGAGAGRKKIAKAGSKPRVAIDPVFQPVADVLTTVPNIFSPVESVLTTVADSTVTSTVQDILPAVPNVFSTIANVFAPVSPIFSLIPSDGRPGETRIDRCLPLPSLAQQCGRTQNDCKTSPQNKRCGFPHNWMTPFILAFRCPLNPATMPILGHLSTTDRKARRRLKESWKKVEDSLEVF